MATNYIQPGDILTITAPETVASGGVVVAGAIVGIAAGDALADAPVDVATRGIFTLPKVAANDFTLGAIVYFDDATGLATTTASGNTKLGVAVAPAAAATGTVALRLSGF